MPGCLSPGGECGCCELSGFPSSTDSHDMGNTIGTHPVQFPYQLECLSLKLNRFEMIVVEMHAQMAWQETVGRYRLFPQPPGAGYIAVCHHLPIQPAARINTHYTEIINGARDLLKITLSALQSLRCVMWQANHEEGGNLDA